MQGSPSAVLTQGFGAWGGAALMLTLGFGTGSSDDITGTIRGVMDCRSVNTTIKFSSPNSAITSRSPNRRTDCDSGNERIDHSGQNARLES